MSSQDPQSEPTDAGPSGLSVARVVKFTLAALVLGVVALIVAAVLNPDPAALPVDYGGFD